MITGFTAGLVYCVPAFIWGLGTLAMQWPITKDMTQLTHDIMSTTLLLQVATLCYVLPLYAEQHNFSIAGVYTLIAMSWPFLCIVWLLSKPDVAMLILAELIIFIISLALLRGAMAIIKRLAKWRLTPVFQLALLAMLAICWNLNIPWR